MLLHEKRIKMNNKKQLTIPSNGNGYDTMKLPGRSYPDARILITDSETYEKVIDYVDGEAVKKEAVGSILDRKTKYTFRTGNIIADGFRRTLELTGVKSEIKSEIEKIVMRN